MTYSANRQTALLDRDDAPSECNSARETDPKEGRTWTQAGAIHAIAQSIVARGAMIGVNAATGIVTARALAPLGRGELSAMIMWPVFLANAMTLGIPNALRYNLRKNVIAARDLIGAALLLSVVSNILAAAIAAWLMPRILHLYSPLIVRYAQLFLINAPICILVQLCRATFEASHDFKASTRSQWLIPAMNLLGLVLLAVFHFFSTLTAGYVYVFAGAPVILWLLSEVWKNYRPRLHRLQESAKILLSYGVRSYGIDLCTTLSLYVDQTLVVGMLGPEAMGTYIVALSLSRMLSQTVQASVVMVLFPKAVGRSKEEIIEITGRAARVTMLCTASMASVIYIFGPSVLRLLYGRAYVSAVPLLRVLLVEVVLASLTGVLAQAAMALGRPGIVTLLQSIGLSLTIPFMMFLIPRFGTLGAAYALLMSTSCRFLFVQCSFRLFLDARCPRLWLSRFDFRDLATHGTGIFPGLSRMLLALRGSAG
jgi:O-antigen/teichoic acid export membrane protein